MSTKNDLQLTIEELQREIQTHKDAALAQSKTISDLTTRLDNQKANTIYYENQLKGNSRVFAQREINQQKEYADNLAKLKQDAAATMLKIVGAADKALKQVEIEAKFAILKEHAATLSDCFDRTLQTLAGNTTSEVPTLH